MGARHGAVAVLVCYTRMRHAGTEVEREQAAALVPYCLTGWLRIHTLNAG